MTTSKSSKVSIKPIEVSKALQDGEKFIKWDEDSGTGLPVTLRVDPKGFYLYWTDQNMEVEMLDIATIRDVRTGVHAKLPKDPKIRNVVLIGSQGSLEEKTVTVCHGLDFVNITFVNFCCTRKEIAQMWTEELFALAYNINQFNNPTIKFLEKLHTKIVLQADKSGKILVKNIVRLFAQNKDDKKRVEKALSETGLPTRKNETISKNKFSFEDFFTLYKNLTQRTEVQKIFNDLTGGKPHLSANQLVDFLNEVQRDPRLNEILHPYADLQRAKDLIKTYEHNKYHQQRSQLTLDGFLRFLMSEDNPIVAPSKLDLCDDMDQPMAHYFINSSHNTYLTGHQITGKSSVEIYRQGLLAGCRCVELDFWNSRTEEPVIVHGYTFVPDISAKEVLEAIAESAFKTSDYPVILSFENHCNPRQQAKIANYCRDIFGDMLLDKPLDSHPLEPGGQLPSPNLLKNKIIIKNKKKHHHHHKKEETEKSVTHGNGEVARGPLTQQGSKDSSESSETESSSEEEGGEVGAGSAGEAAAAGGEAGEAARETHAAAEISALVNYVQPVHFSSFENAEKKSRFYEMSSFDEKQATALLKEKPVEFVNYNKQQLSRVYPAGTRFDSSNFMPQLFWNAGCQLVALNYQTPDLAMQLNLGAFEYNARSGYLLKPEFMRRRDRRLDPFAESTVDGIIAGSLSVRVLSGQLLGRRAAVCVEVDLLGLPADTVRKRRTPLVHNNAINPVYDHEPFVFKKVVLPELAMVRVAALDDGGRLVGQRVLPVRGLCSGYRHVGLRTELGLPLAASLLLHVEVKDYVPDRHIELATALENPIKYHNDMDRRAQQLAVLTDDADEPRAEHTTTHAHTHAHAPADAPAPAPGPAPTTAPDSAAHTHAVSPARGPGGDKKENDSGSRTTEKEEIDKINGSKPTPEDVEEALKTLLNSKMVKDKKTDLTRKLEALRRKNTKPRTVSAKLFVKRLSTRNMTEEPDEAGVEAERELRLRHHHALYAALDKQLRLDHHHQMKHLTESLEAKKKDILLRLASCRREAVKTLSKTARDKDELLRRKREIDQESVARGVNEVSDLEKNHACSRAQLVFVHERLLAALEHRRDQDLQELERLCRPSPEG